MIAIHPQGRQPTKDKVQPTFNVVDTPPLPTFGHPFQHHKPADQCTFQAPPEDDQIHSVIYTIHNKIVYETCNSK